MLRVLSVHLALKSYDDFGCCLLTSGNGTGAAAEFPNPAGIGLKGVPHAEHCADVLAAYCEGSGANVLLLDGPQGWKDPSTRSEDCRICERLLNTTGKVGLPGRAQPATFLPFAQFCIDLFTALARRGGVRPDFEPFTAPTRGFLLLETFPTAAWVALGLEPLKPREKVKIDDPAQACRNLQVQVPVTFRHAVNHAEAQALVAGLAGIAVAAGNHRGYEAVGAPLFQMDGVPREGYIVNPTPTCLGGEKTPSGRIVLPPGPGRRRF